MALFLKNKNRREPVSAAEAGRSLSSEALLRLSKNRLAVVSAIFLFLLTTACVLGPWILDLDYRTNRLEVGATAPSSAFFFGTDMLGRDVFARVLYGGRISLMVAFVATSVALVIGVVYGALAGYVGGKTDSLMMRLVDIFYALPFTFVVILMMVFLKEPIAELDSILRRYALFEDFAGIGKVIALFAAIGAVEWLTMARIVRSQVQATKRKEFIEAARSLGFSHTRILFRHILPNCVGPIIVFVTLTVPSVMLLESFLSFLGLGTDASMSSWGTLIKDGQEKLEEYPWLLAFPGAAFSLTLFSLNFLGDGIRDVFDVRSSRD